MPRHMITYPAEMRETPEGQYLYGLWNRMRHGGRDKHFEQYSQFYNWAIANGYTYGASFRRIDEKKPWGRKNCVLSMAVETPQRYSEEDKKIISQWNRTVNRFRVCCGLKPFPVEVENNG